MKFENIESVKAAIAIIPTDRANRRMYGLNFKKAVFNFLSAKKMNIHHFCLATGLSDGMLSTWRTHNNNGLFENCSDSVCSVSRTVLKTNETILQDLEKEMVHLKEKMDLIKKCEVFGLKLAA